MDCLLQVERSLERSIIRVVGRLTGAQVPDLLKACDARGGTCVVVDLTDLVSTDIVGLQALRRLEADGALLTNVPRYLASKLDC